MKKTLAALAVLGAFAGSAAAADVTLYGVVDLGLNYQYSKVGDADAVNTFKEQAGQNSGSRFGLKGTEDLGNGVKVGLFWKTASLLMTARCRRAAVSLAVKPISS